MFDLSAYISASGEVVCAFAGGDTIEQLSDFLPEGFEVALGGFAEPRLEFGKELFDRVQIRRVGGKIEHGCAGGGDRSLHSSHFVTAEIVEDHGVSRSERWAQELTHIRQKYLAVHGAIGHHRCGQTVAAQGAHKSRRLPMSVRRRVDTTLAAGGTPVASRHARRYPSFIDEYELFDFHRGQRLRPCFTRPLHVLALLLAGVQGFF